MTFFRDDKCIRFIPIAEIFNYLIMRKKKPSIFHEGFYHIFIEIN